MQDRVSVLAQRVVQASDDLRAAIDEGEQLAALTNPPTVLYAAARALERWAGQLQDGTQ